MPKVARDAVTGEFVTMEYARENPDTTVVETVGRAGRAGTTSSGTVAG